MAYHNDDYKPNKASRAILARAWEHVQSVQYRATSRWLFYRLLQDGLYHGKKDYQTFLGLFSRARHNYWEGWRPNTLADDTRQSRGHATGYRNVEEWAKEMVKYGRTPVLDHWFCQEQYVEVWFEAEAMRAQFEYYTRGLTLRPFKGMPSIDYKWGIAKDLEKHEARYGLPIVILYFGDYDGAGVLIPETSVADIEDWCKVDFDFERVGLNAGDGERLGIPENFEKPGTYQWEALPDSAARDMITGAVGTYVDVDIIGGLERQARAAGEQFRQYMQDFSLSSGA